MPTRSRPAIVTLRMSRPLRDALHEAAAGAGCSLNAYALQILAAAAGDPARFPLRPTDRSEHRLARRAFFDAMTEEHGASAADQLVRQHEIEDPAFFVEWARRRAG